MIEGLNRLINQAKVENNIKGIPFTRSFSISHLDFVDDVLLFGMGWFQSGGCIKTLLIASVKHLV